MKPLQIFVSYSHVDRRWFVDKDQPYSLIPWLQYVLRRQDVVFWYDRSDETGLQPGDRFREEIEQNIDRSEIALLLLSDAFFASDFIQAVELPRLLEREQANQIIVIPILLEPCGWLDFEFVAQRHMLPGTPTPLISYTRNDADWSEARNVIREAISRRAKAVRGKGLISTEPGARQTVSPSEAIAATGPSEDRTAAAKAPEVPSPAAMPAPAMKTAEDKYTLANQRVAIISYEDGHDEEVAADWLTYDDNNWTMAEVVHRDLLLEGQGAIPFDSIKSIEFGRENSNVTAILLSGPAPITGSLKGSAVFIGPAEDRRVSVYGRKGIRRIDLYPDSPRTVALNLAVVTTAGGATLTVPMYSLEIGVHRPTGIFKWDDKLPLSNGEEVPLTSLKAFEVIPGSDGKTNRAWAITVNVTILSDGDSETTALETGNRYYVRGITRRSPFLLELAQISKIECSPPGRRQVEDQNALQTELTP
jgi:hypothetical protein